MKAGNWKETVAETLRAGQKRIGSMVKAPTQGFSKWLGEQNTATKGALVFGGVLAAGLGAYALAKAFDKKKEKKEDQWQEKASKQPKTATAHIG
jgi:hypothetical protein